MGNRQGSILLFATLLGLAGSRSVVAESLAECDARTRGAEVQVEAFRCFREAARDGDPEVVVELLERRLADPGPHPRVLLALAWVEQDRGSDRAPDLLTRAASAESPAVRAGAELSLAGLHRRTGDREAMTLALDRALAAAEESGSSDLEAEVLARTGWSAYVFDDYGRAETLFRRARALLTPAAPRRVAALAIDGTAAVERSLGRLHAALREYLELAATMEGEDPRWWSRSLYAAALVAVDLERRGELDRTELVTALERALEAAKASRNPTVEARTRMLLADYSEVPDALAHLEAAESYVRSREDPVDLGAVLRHRLRVRLRSAPVDWTAVEAETAEMGRLAERTGRPWELAKARQLEAEVAWAGGRVVEATRASTVALDAIERLRDLQPDDMVRARSFAEWTYSYTRFAALLLAHAPTDLEEAFRVVERMRSRVLLDHLDAAGATAAVGGEQGRALGAAMERRDVLEAELETATEDLDRRTILARIEEAEAEVERLRTEIAVVRPRYLALRAPSYPTLEAVRESLGDGEILVSLQLGDRADLADGWPTRPWGLRVSSDGIRWAWLGDEGELEEAARLLSGLVAARDPAEARAAAALYRRILAPLLPDPGAARRLVIVADRWLQTLPFHALRARDGGAPLGTLVEIELAPSVTAWSRWRGQPPRAWEEPVLVLADPTTATRPTADRESTLPTLPGARREGREVVRRLGGGQLVVGADATEGALHRPGLERTAIVHLAAHAVLDATTPERSAVLLGPEPPLYDGRLEIREIVGLPLSGRLVVLTACRSTDGVTIRGEGVVSLAHAFFQAGAVGVVGSPWPLRDDEAEVLTAELYRGLADGRPVSEALLRARRRLFEAGRPVAAWGGLVLFGGGFTPFPGGVEAPLPWRWTLAGVGGLVLGVGLLVGWRSRSRP